MTPHPPPPAPVPPQRDVPMTPPPPPPAPVPPLRPRPYGPSTSRSTRRNLTCKRLPKPGPKRGDIFHNHRTAQVKSEDLDAKEQGQADKKKETTE
eukprot:g14210.t1